MILWLYRKLFCWDKRKIRWFKQRLTRGFDEKDLWSLDHTIAKFLLPRLKAFKNLKAGYPGSLETEEEWEEILDKMIFSWEACLNFWEPPENIIGDREKLREWQDRVDEGIKCFCDYLGNLWS